MSTLKRSLFGLLLAPVVLGAALPGSAFASRAHQPIALQATLRGRSLQVTGSNFDPSAHVALALIDTRSWKTIFRGAATAEPAIYTCPRSVNAMCGQRDPYAGYLYFATTLQRRPARALLAVLYRSGPEVGVGRVRSQ